jgi:ABC-type sugar transport system ATPase subunit
VGAAAAHRLFLGHPTTNERLAKEGCALVVISSELPEVLALCDRVGVMREGRLVHTIDDCTGLTEGLLMKYASGEVAVV